MKPLAIAILSLLVVTASHAKPTTLRIAVASNFHETLDTIARAFEAETRDNSVQLIPGSTGKVFAQIKSGAPYDAFFSADTERPRLLEQSELIIPDSRYTYAIGVLALWTARKDLDLTHAPELLASSGYQKLAIANPLLAPYGKAAAETLEKLGLTSATRTRLIKGSNISQAFHFTATQSADLGFVALSQIKEKSLDPSTFWIPDSSLYSPIEQQAVLLSDTPESRAFYLFCKSATARQIIVEKGYRIP